MRDEAGGSETERASEEGSISPSEQRRKKESAEEGADARRGSTEEKGASLLSLAFSSFFPECAVSLFPSFFFFLLFPPLSFFFLPFPSFSSAAWNPTSIYPRNRRYPFWQAIFSGKTFSFPVSAARADKKILELAGRG